MARGAPLLLLLVLVSAGCSAVAAFASKPRDIAVLRVGAGRRAVEKDLGRPKAVESREGGARVTYRVRVLDPKGPRVPSAAANLGVAGALATSTGLAVARGCRDLEPFDRAAGVAAGAVTFVTTDLFLAARTLVRAGQHPRCEIVVEYGADGAVRSYDVRER